MMNCIICSHDKWENVDQYRVKPSGMEMCTNCSFISYPSRWKSKKEIIDYYRKDYRQPPRSDNLFSGQRKLHFHNLFLSPIFEEWNKKGKDAPEVFEIGAAFGMVLEWVRKTYPGAKVGGTELTTTYKRVAYHEYGLNLVDDIDDTKKYDLIISYKVAEHMLDFNQELDRYVKCLNDDGYLYISVPTWFDSLNNFGLSGFDLEYYYSPDHVNVWTREMFESLLYRAGLTIVKKDYLVYDATYICQKAKILAKVEYSPEDKCVEKKRDLLKRVQESHTLQINNKNDEAIAVYPNYPQAHSSRYELMRKDAHAKGWEWAKQNVIDFAFKSCPESNEIYILAADVAMRFEKYPEAIEYCRAGLKTKPENPVMLNMLINTMRELSMRANSLDERNHYFKQARDISIHLGKVSMQNFRESTDMRYLYGAQMATEHE